jgi:hypothetical protein
MGRISVLGWLGTLAHALMQTPIFDYTSIENIENKGEEHVRTGKGEKGKLLLWF